MSLVSIRIRWSTESSFVLIWYRYLLTSSFKHIYSSHAFTFSHSSIAICESDPYPSQSPLYSLTTVHHLTRPLSMATYQHNYYLYRLHIRNISIASIGCTFRPRTNNQCWRLAGYESRGCGRIGGSRHCSEYMDALIAWFFILTCMYICLYVCMCDFSSCCLCVMFLACIFAVLHLSFLSSFPLCISFSTRIYLLFVSYLLYAQHAQHMSALHLILSVCFLHASLFII